MMMMSNNIYKKELLDVLETNPKRNGEKKKNRKEIILDPDRLKT
jgi:hypothetical protein